MPVGFIKEVLALQDANINFAQYDNDGPDPVIPNSGDDGFVDFAVFVQAMEGEPTAQGGYGAIPGFTTAGGERLIELWMPQPERRLHQGGKILFRPGSFLRYNLHDRNRRLCLPVCFAFRVAVAE